MDECIGYFGKKKKLFKICFELVNCFFVWKWWCFEGIGEIGLMFNDENDVDDGI